jgi:hypothetical protein
MPARIMLLCELTFSFYVHCTVSDYGVDRYGDIVPDPHSKVTYTYQYTNAHTQVIHNDIAPAINRVTASRMQFTSIMLQCSTH